MGLFHQWIDRDKFKEIFRSHWESFKDTYSRYRAGRYDEAVQKMLGCGDPANGYATYICCDCGGDRCEFSDYINAKFLINLSDNRIFQII